MLLFFGALYGALSARPRRSRKACSTSTSTGAWSNSRARASWSDVASGNRLEQYRLRDLVPALDKAKDDSRVKAVALDLDGFTGGGQRRSATLPTPCGGCARRASR